MLEATADLVAEVGVDRVTIDEVAARSGVAKTTIYRHWPTKQALVVDAVRVVCFPEAATPNTGDLRADLIACFEGMVRAGLSGRTGQMLPSLLDGAHRDAALDVLLRDYLRERSGPTRTVLQLAQLRGELPADLDLDFAVTLVIGPLHLPQGDPARAGDGSLRGRGGGRHAAGPARVGAGPAAPAVEARRRRAPA